MPLLEHDDVQGVSHRRQWSCQLRAAAAAQAAHHVNEEAAEQRGHNGCQQRDHPKGEVDDLLRLVEQLVAGLRISQPGAPSYCHACGPCVVQDDEQ